VTSLRSLEYALADAFLPPSALLVACALREPRCCTPAGVSVVLIASYPRMEDGLEGDGRQLYRERVCPEESSEQEEEDGQRGRSVLFLSPFPAYSLTRVVSSRPPCILRIVRIS
jgi:hypothetical protein